MFPNNLTVRTLRSAALLAGFVAALAGQTAPPNSFVVTNLVANTAGTAQITDPNLLDPWGLSISAASPFWVSNHLSGTSTLYNGSGVITPTVVKIAPGAASATGSLGRPTGQVNNAGAGFILPNGTKASFIFSTEDGTIQGWNSGTASVIMADNSAAGAVYKGLAIGTSALGQTLYAANFRTGNIDVFDSTFKPATVAGGFKNTAIPAGFAPFNIWPVGTTMYVMYAKQDPAKFADVPGAGNGYVASYDFNGNLVSTLVSGGVLNSPWGVAVAPAGWGPFGGALLVGNFGDGTINAFDAKAGTLLGTLQNTSGAKIQLAGLWAILFGNGGRGGDVNTLYFAAGNPTPPPGAAAVAPRGILGSIAPPAAIKQVLSAASFTASAGVAPGELVTILGQSVGLSPSVAAVIPTSGFLGTQLQQTGTTFTARVSVNGVNAPILYSNGNQTSIQVPYAVAGLPSADFVITANGQTTDKFTVPVVFAAPGLFTDDVSGKGQVVAFNQDGTLNTASNPAAKGSYIQMYATGEGVMFPSGVDGAVQTGYVRVPAGAVNVSIGGAPATAATFAGSIPGLLTGLILVEAPIPAATATGAVPVVLTIGGNSSPAGTTISVK